MEQRIEGTQRVGQVCLRSVRAAWQKRQKQKAQANYRVETGQQVLTKMTELGCPVFKHIL